MTRPWIDLLAEAVAIRVAAGAVIALNDAATAGADLSGLAAAYTTDGDRP